MSLHLCVQIRGIVSKEKYETNRKNMKKGWEKNNTIKEKETEKIQKKRQKSLFIIFSIEKERE